MRKIVLVAAATGRDYMIAKQLSACPDVELSVVIWADSSYIKKLCNGQYHVVDLNDVEKVCQIISKINPDYVIPGQGDILQHGLTDTLHKMNILCVGPVQALAKIEGSKAFMREVMSSIDSSLNPKHKDFLKFDGSVLEFIDSFDSDIVVKCDYVISGPRVKIFNRETEYDRAVEISKLWLEKYGHIIIEEFISGEEISLTTYTDGKNVLHAPLTQNHKRIFDNNKGDNTSGMGSLTGFHCFDTLPDDTYSKLKNLNEKVLNTLYDLTGCEYIGSIYGEFIITKKGIKVIEYNCRFGNPCSLSIFSLMNFPILTLMDAMAYKSIDKINNNAFKDLVSVAVYAVPQGFTISKENVGKEVDFGNLKEETFYYGNLKNEDNKYYLKNSRAFAVCDIGTTVKEARNKVYSELEKVKGNIYYRKDIGICKWSE